MKKNTYNQDIMKEEESTKKGIYSCEEDNIFVLYPIDKGLFFLPYHNNTIKDSFISKENVATNH